jgi:hypothetical protein
MGGFTITDFVCGANMTIVKRNNTGLFTSKSARVGKDNFMGRAMAQAVSRRSLTAGVRVRSRISPCGMCGGQSGTGTSFSQVLQFFPVNFVPLVLHYKEKRKKLIIFITGFHNKPQGCGASVAYTAGPCTTEKKRIILERF